MNSLIYKSSLFGTRSFVTILLVDYLRIYNYLDKTILNRKLRINYLIKLCHIFYILKKISWNIYIYFSKDVSRIGHVCGHSLEPLHCSHRLVDAALNNWLRTLIS